MVPSQLDYLEVNSSSLPPQAGVIWLHGLGADGYDFMGIVPELQLPEQFALRFIFPHAPIQAVSINAGQRMRAWYDISHPDLSRDPDYNGILASVGAVQQLLQQQQVAGIPAHRIVLAGFSQGGVIALHAGLRHLQALAGILVLSAYFPVLPDGMSAFADAAQKIPIAFLHGEHDPVVPMGLAYQGYQALQQAGYAVQWQTYPMQHSVCNAEIQAISGYLQQWLTP